MKLWAKIVIVSVLSLSVLFVGLGYAALTDNLTVSGDLRFDIPSGLFITSIEESTQSNVDSQSATYIGYSTTIDCSIDKTQGNNATGTVSYRVTVYNNTERVYAYRGLYYQTSSDGLDSAYNGNDSISETAGNRAISVNVDFGENSSIIQPHEQLTVTVTYTLGSRLDASTAWRTLINFQFGINVDSPEEAIDSVVNQFSNVLNSSATYEQLIDQIDNKYDGRGWTATYFGNVAGSSNDDSVAINTLFAGQLNMLINGVERPVTVIIKRENIDGNTNTGDDYTVTNGTSTTSGYGCEYTLYMTTEDLNSYNSYPTVYAMVYTCDRDADGNLGEWYMIGEYYEGTAQVVGYIGGTSGGSFDTGSWRAVSQTLSPSEEYSYSIANNSTINTIVTAKDESANRAFQALLDDAYVILTENKYAGTGMVALEQLYERMADIYTIGADGAPTVNDVSRAVLIPYIQQMEDGLKQFELSELEALAKVSYAILAGTSGTAEERGALQSAYDAAKAEGLFTDAGGTIVVADDATYTELKAHVDNLFAAYAPFESD